MPLALVTHRDFSGGVYRDVPPHLIPENGVYDAVDCILNQPGIIRKRGGTTALYTGAQTAYGETLGAIHDPRYRRLYAFGRGGSAATTGSFASIDTTTSTPTAAGALFTNISAISRAFNHLGHILVAFYPNTGGSTNAGLVKIGGATGAKADILTGQSATITAGNATITMGGHNNTDMEVGMYVVATDDVDATKHYVGRITSLPATVSTITVEPTPTESLSCSSGHFLVQTAVGNVTTTQPWGAKLACSFQDRVVLANLAKISADGVVQRYPNRFAWSILPTETPSTLPSASGYTQLYTAEAFEANNFDTIVDADELTAVVPVGSDLIAFSVSAAWRVSGELTTQTAVEGGVTWTVSPLSQSVGCISDRSLQASPRGLLFAAEDGVYAFDGSAMRPIMQGRVANTYRDALRSGAVVYGSALLGENHYLLSMSDHARLVNLDTLAWTRLTNTQLMDATADPADPTKLWALRWWNQAAAAPSMTNGQAVQVDSILRPSSATRLDADGSAVQAQIVTRSFDEDNPGVVKRFRDPELGWVLANGGSVTVQAAATLDPAAASWQTVGTITATQADPEPTRLGMTGVVRGAGVAYQFTQSGAADAFELVEIRNRFEPVSVA